MKKILMLLVAIFITLIANATTIYVNGNKITGSTLIQTGGGSVEYNATTKTLIIQNVNFSRSGSDNNGIDNQDVDGLKINFIGDNSMTIANADVLNLRAATTVSFRSGTTTLKCTAGGQNAIKARGANVTVCSYNNASLKLISTNGAAIEGKTGKESLIMQTWDCEIESAREAFLNFGTVMFQSSPSSKLTSGITKTSTITIKAHSSTTYAHASGIIMWSGNTNFTIKEPEYGLKPSELTQSSLATEKVLITDEHNAEDLTAIGNFLYSTRSLDNMSCAELVGPTVDYKYSRPSVIAIPGFAKLEGYLYPVYVDNYALSAERNPYWKSSVNEVRFEFGVKYVGSYVMYNLENLQRIYLPSSVKSLSDNMIKGAGNSYSDMGVYWSTLDPSTTTMGSPFAGTAVRTVNIYLPTTAVITTALGIEAITKDAAVYKYAVPKSCYDYKSFGNYYVVTAWNMQSSDMCEMALVGTDLSALSITDYDDYVRGNAGQKTYYCTSVAPEAFMSDRTITSAALTSSHFKTVGAKAFYGCSKLISAVFGSSLQLIGREAFSHSSISQSLTIPSGAIGEYAFSHCVNLEELVLGDRVTAISGFAFYSSSNLLNITSEIPDPSALTYGTQIFSDDTYSYGILYIPAGTLSLYKATMPWSRFLNIVDPKPFDAGDVNGDGSVNAGDVSAIYNVMLGVETAPDIISRANVNGDTSVNAGDVSAVYNFMLNQ